MAGALGIIFVDDEPAVLAGMRRTPGGTEGLALVRSGDHCLRKPFNSSDDEVEILVVNTGIGIAPGLTLTKNFLEPHQDRLDIESKLDKGTAVRMCLPKQPPGASVME